MTLNEDFEILDPAEEVQKAFDESNGSGSRHAWTARRQSAAMSLGCHIMEATGDDLQELVARGTYSNVFRDVVIVSWLSAISDDEVLEINAFLDTKKAVKKAFEWADTIGLEYGTTTFFDGLQMINREVKKILTSHFRFTGDSEPVKKNTTNRPGKSDSPITPPKPADTPLSIA